MGRSGHFNVLISAAGRRVALLESFRAALRALNRPGRVLAADASRLAAAFHAADQGFDVPLCQTPGYLPALEQICADYEVALLVPTIDPELPVLAEARLRLEELGTVVAVSAPDAVAIAADKVLLHKWLTYHGLPTVRQTTVPEALAAPVEWPLPLVVKPQCGSASLDVSVISRLSELELALQREDLVVQSLARGSEYTVDALVNRSGQCVCAVPRRRIEVRAGEVAKGMTVRHPPLERVVKRLAEELPGAYGPLTVQAFVDERGRVTIIEVNARFGGGFPLSWRAGAHYPLWMIEELLGVPSTASENWQDGLVMLRYDDAIFVDASEVGLR